MEQITFHLQWDGLPLCLILKSKSPAWQCWLLPPTSTLTLFLFGSPYLADPLPSSHWFLPLLKTSWGGGRDPGDLRSGWSLQLSDLIFRSPMLCVLACMVTECIPVTGDSIPGVSPDERKQWEWVGIDYSHTVRQVTSSSKYSASRDCSMVSKLRLQVMVCSPASQAAVSVLLSCWVRVLHVPGQQMDSPARGWELLC